MPESADDLFCTLTNLTHQIKNSDTIDPYYERTITHLVDKFNKVQIGQGVDSDRCMKLGSLLVEFLCKKAANSFHRFLHDQIMRNSTEVLMRIKEAVLVLAKMANPKMIDYSICFRLYLSIFCRSVVENSIVNGVRINESIWTELITYCDNFFERAASDKMFYVKDLSKSPMFKSITARMFDHTNQLATFPDFLAYCYVMHVAVNYLDVYGELLDEPESKLTQASKNSMLGFLVKCVISNSVLQKKVLCSSSIKNQLGKCVNSESLEFVRRLLQAEGTSVQLLECELCRSSYLREDQTPTLFEEKNICDVCLLSLGMKDEHKLETNHENASRLINHMIHEKNETVFEKSTEKSDHRVILDDRHHAVLMAICFNEMFPGKFLSSNFEPFFNTTEQCYSGTIDCNTTNPAMFEIELFNCIVLRKLVEFKWLVSRKTHDLLLYFATQRTAHNNFGVVAERIRRITKRFPLMLLSPKYFNIVSLLQFEKSLDIKSFVLSAYVQLIESVPLAILSKFSFKSKAILDQIQDFCFACLSHHFIELKRESMLAISTMIDNGVLRFNFQDSKATFKNRLLSDDSRTLSKDKHRKLSTEITSVIMTQPEKEPIGFSFISDEQLRGLLNACANNKDEEINIGFLTVIFKLIEFIDRDDDPQGTKSTVVVEEHSAEKPLTRSAYKSVKKTKQEDESNLKISKSKKSKLTEEKVSELTSRLLTLISLKPPSLLDKLSNYWLVAFFKQFYLQILPEIRAIVLKLISKKELLQDQLILTLLYSILFNEKAIKTTSVLCETAITLASSMNFLLKTEESMANFENFEFGNSAYSRLEERQREVLNLQARCLLSTIAVLNRHELNLFYKEPVNNLLIFLGLRMFEFPLKIFKLLVKVKIMIDLNFQIFQNIEISLRKNTNFLSLTLSQISSSFPQTGVPEPLQLSYGTLIPVIKCIHFVRKLLEMMPKNIFNESFMCLVFGLIVKMAEVPERNLIQESGLVLPLFFELGILKMNVVYEIMDKVMAHDFGLKAVLFISGKLVKKNRGHSFVGLLWRRYVDKIYNNIETRLFGNRPTLGSNKDIISEQSNSHPLLNEAELGNALETILFLAKNKEVDLVRLFVLANGWIFSRIKKCSIVSSQIVAEILTLDSRISSNKGTIFDVLRRMSVSFSNFKNDTLSNFVEVFHESFSFGKKISLQNFFAVAVDVIFEFGSNQNHPDFKTMEEAFDMFMLTILISSPENFKVSFLTKIGEALITSISRLQAEFMLVKKQIALQREARRKSNPGNNPPDADFMAIPKRLAKNIYYLLWICSSIFYEIEKTEMPNTDTKLREQLREKYLGDSLKVLKDITQRKGIVMVENDPRFLLLLSQKLDNINFLENSNILKKIIDKLENNPFLNLNDNDEFNRDLLFISREKAKSDNAQRVLRHAPARQQSRTPAKKIKRPPKTTNAKKTIPVESSHNKTPILNKTPEIIPKYGYRRSIMEKRLINFS